MSPALPRFFLSVSPEADPFCPRCHVQQQRKRHPADGAESCQAVAFRGQRVQDQGERAGQRRGKGREMAVPRATWPAVFLWLIL